uniref:WD_REPEATS_REGION domain-containing protein n=1 Tax=Meloidogyne hapla TaxID=6305 RepID=A0A1I8C0D9_MELHA
MCYLMMHAPIYGYSTVVPEPLNAVEQLPIRTNLSLPEGVYRQATTANEYFRSNRMPTQVAGPACNSPVRISFLKIPKKKLNYVEEALPSTSNKYTTNTDLLDHRSSPLIEATNYLERICLNIGREIYVFDYSGTNGMADTAKIVDKRVYKGTFPTCHDFNKENSSPSSCLLLIGFSAGQIQLIDPQQKEMPNSKLFNEERQIDRTAVTCLRWIPDGRSFFVASHASGNLYLYNDELDSSTISPTYQVLKQGDCFTVFTCKSKVSRNPVHRWQIGTGAINSFAFSGSNSNFIATVSQDGFLRIFNWRTMELIGCMRSYFGGLLCLAWSPDLRYIATGGEDDLLSLYSVTENRVVCRGQGHKSWISEIAFDYFASSTNSLPNDIVYDESTMTDEILLSSTANTSLMVHTASCSSSIPNHSVFDDNQEGEINSQLRIIYRIGSVGHDCQLCLWDISDDILLSSSCYSRNSRNLQDIQTEVSSPVGALSPGISPIEINQRNNTTVIPIGIDNSITLPKENEINGLKSDKLKNGGGGRFRRLHKRGLSIGSRLTGNNEKNNRQNGISSSGAHSVDGTLKRGDCPSFAAKLFGTPQCPRIEEIPIIEPILCKKVANGRLGSIHFRENCIVTACQEDYICIWIRPNAQNIQQEGRHSSTNTNHHQQQNHLMSTDCSNECQRLSSDNFASTCV